MCREMQSNTFAYTMRQICALFSVCFQDFVDRKVVVSVRCGECTAGGGEGGGGCLKEMSVTALRTTVTITDTGMV